MFQNVPHRKSIDFFGQTITLESGILAQQATASVLASQGETTLLAAVVVGKPTAMDFLPLQVIYEEKLYASGKIKGSRFIKREGRPTDNAILTGRLVDRSIRSLFDDSIRNEIQVIITVLSLDEINPPDTLAVIAASTALTMAGVDGFTGPVSSVRVGLSSNKEHLILNPTYTQLKESQLDLVISGTGSNIVMLEAGAHIVSEEYIAQAMEQAMPALATLTTLQTEFVQLTGNKETATQKSTPSSLHTQLAQLIEARLESAMYTTDVDKLQKHAAIAQVKQDLFHAIAYCAKKPVEGYIQNELTARALQLLPQLDAEQLNETLQLVERSIELLQKDLVEKNILENKKRLDGRKLDEVRPLTIQTDVLPRVHGSSLFQRGETQVVNILTLGTLRDAQTLDDMEDFEETTKRYIHHYNFPQFSVGETGRYAGPGRREIGHGALAEKALIPVLPSEEQFPYTMRLVSECFGSNGSSSMASTCSSSLSLMAGGVPISAAVAGIAMGVVVRGNSYAILTDIQGEEDHLGDMDFKVTGTKEGVTAIQLDNKISGLTVEILTKALFQAKEARHFILEQMNAVIAQPKSAISPHAPKVTTLSIPLEKVGDVIGPQGKIIKNIIAQTDVQIDIEDDTGKTCIYAKNTENAQKAVEMIQSIIREYIPGESVQGKVFRIESYGAFIKFDNEKEGMIHISRMSQHRVEKVEDVMQLGDVVTAYVVEVNEKGQIALSLLPISELPKQENSKNNHRRSKPR